MPGTEIRFDDALQHLLGALRRAISGTSTQLSAARHYDLQVSVIVQNYWRPKGVEVLSLTQGAARKYSESFLDAAWYLCRIGVLRPGENEIHQSMRGVPVEGDGFTITGFGAQWLLLEAASTPVDPDRYVEVISRYLSRFGEAFRQRAAEASSCYRTANYLACCVMTGAAAEAILVSAATAKLRSEEEALKLYRAAAGRKKLLERLTKGQTSVIIGPLTMTLGNLYNWRDESGHGLPSGVSEVHAFNSLGYLLRLADLCFDNWDQLTT